jgi:hypothetical protein
MLFFFAGAVLTAAICVFIASRAYSDWKLRGILFDSFAKIQEIKRWEYSTVSYNYFTKNVVVSGLQFFLENGGSLYIGKVAGALDNEGSPSHISFKNIQYNTDNFSFAISSLNCAGGNLSALASINWRDFNIDIRSALVGHWKNPPINFSRITAESIEYKEKSAAVQMGNLTVGFKKSAGDDVYSINSEAVTLSFFDKPIFYIDNLTDIKSYNADKSTHEEFLTIHSKALASVSLHYTLDMSGQKLKVLRLNYTDRSFLYTISSLYHFIGGSVRQENQWLLTETFSAFISNIIGGEITGKLELMDAIHIFLEKPEKFDLDIDGEGNIKLSLNSEKPIYIKIIPSAEEPEGEDLDIAPPTSGETNEFEALESPEDGDAFEEPPLDEPIGEPLEEQPSEIQL